MNLTSSIGLPSPLGVSVLGTGINIAVLAPNASAVYFCLFNSDEQEIARVHLQQRSGDVHHGCIEHFPVSDDGFLYGLRADGDYEPSRGLFYDLNKLLVDPYAIELNRSFVFDAALAADKSISNDTASLVPKAVFRPQIMADVVFDESNPLSHPPQLIYEVSVKAFTQLHPNVPEHLRGTVAALREPCVIEHFLNIGVDTVELMPIAAWVNERHLAHMGLHNAWGYNPIAMMVTEPSLCPNGWRELRETVAALKAVGIQTILDVVFNHTGESDVDGPVLSMRGLDNGYYYKHADNFELINDTGCGNTLACEREGVAQLMIDTMRHWILKTGVAGFRFDLAPVMGRLPTGFSTAAPLLKQIKADELLSKALLIAEPWDIGPGGYQLGQFESPWLEWNDKYRDDVRRFWQGQPNALGGLATRLAGSSDVFGHNAEMLRSPKASVNFLAAHDGFCLRDLVSYSHKYNHANGEDNRDGSNDNHSWSNGVEGELDVAAGVEAIELLKANRFRDMRALLATLFVSQGSVMLTAGDELGRTQQGNNNAYAQDNQITWVNWEAKDDGLIQFVSELAKLRRMLKPLHFDAFLTGQGTENTVLPDAQWWHADGRTMQDADWHHAHRAIGLSLFQEGQRTLVWLNAGHASNTIILPENRERHVWQTLCDTATGSFEQTLSLREQSVSARSVRIWQEVPACSD